MEKDNYGVIIHPKDFEDLLNMKATEAGEIIQNVVKTFLGREDLATFDDRYLTRVSNDMCARVVWDKEQKEKKSRAGSQGGAPKGNVNAKKQTENKQKQAENNQKTSTKQAETTFNSNSNSNSKSNSNIRSYYPANRFNIGAIAQEYDFKAIESKRTKN